MTGEDVKELIKRLGLKNASFARLTRQHKNTIQRHVADGVIDGSTRQLYLLLQARPEMAKVLADINLKK